MTKLKSLFFLSILTSATLAMATMAFANGNVIANSSFEISRADGTLAGWTAGKNAQDLSIDKSTFYDGKHSLHLSLNGGEVLFSQEKYIKLQPGKKYTFSAYIKTKNLNPTADFTFEVINLGWSFGNQSKLQIDQANSDWRRYSRTFVVPAPSQFKYRGHDNDDYKILLTSKASGEIWIDAIQLEQSDSATDYKPIETATYEVQDTVANDIKNIGLQQATYFHVDNPLFETLLSNEPGPRNSLYYGYNDLFADSYREYALKFGHRYVLQEQYQEIMDHHLIPMTNAWARGGVGSYPTMRMILRPDQAGNLPKVLGNKPWMMDPRWQENYVQAAIKLAQQSLDKSPDNKWGNTWGLWAGDEVFESFAIKIVPKEKRYPAMEQADAEIKRDYGFGKFGMPDSEDDPNVFKRIAYRRWVNAKLAETYKSTFEAVKKINPQLKMLGPDQSGAVPPIDYDAITPYFDFIINQSWYGAKPFVRQLANGADAKATVDLSQCPVWQLPQHTFATDLETVREQYSQVYRNGAQGLAILGVHWYDREMEHPEYINPQKWKALLEINDTVTHMNKVKIPKPDTAILYCSDTLLSYPNPKMAAPDHYQMYSAYAALGQEIGSWFSFVSDRQIERGTRKLSDYKILYIPLAKYSRSSVLDKIKDFVKAGGTVVCTDPEAFSWNINGEVLSNQWEELSGVHKSTLRASAPETTIQIKLAALLKQTPVLSVKYEVTGWNINPTDNALTTLATFADGTPAVTSHKYGKGRVITFAIDAFASPYRNIANTEFFKNLQTVVGAKENLPIWRFKLPPFKTVSDENPPSKFVCLTNNNMAFEHSQSKPENNLATNGTYSYENAPTGIADFNSLKENIPFADGHLTNRQTAFEQRDLKGGKNPPELEKWIVSWKDPAPASITFDLKKIYTLDHLALFYSGALPILQIECSVDGKTWITQSSLAAKPATADVLNVEMPLSGNYRYVRLKIGARQSGQEFKLSEVEIWGGGAK
jgi:hypothetical protein